MRSVHFETCEHHEALQPPAREWAERQNDMRFVVTDLVLGRVNQDHRLYRFLRHNGMRVKDLHWFASHPARIDILALDYYIHSEMQWRKTATGLEAARPSCKPRGFASIAIDYVERYGKPIMLGETNIRGSVRDRLGWLKYTHLESERLAARSDVDFRGYGWFPLWDSCAWAHDLCRTAKTEPDPVGIYNSTGRGASVYRPNCPRCFRSWRLANSTRARYRRRVQPPRKRVDPGISALDGGGSPAGGMKSKA